MCLLVAVSLASTKRNSITQLVSQRCHCVFKKKKTEKVFFFFLVVVLSSRGSVPEDGVICAVCSCSMRLQARDCVLTFNITSITRGGSPKVLFRLVFFFLSLSLYIYIYVYICICLLLSAARPTLFLPFFLLSLFFFFYYWRRALFFNYFSG